MMQFCRQKTLKLFPGSVLEVSSVVDKSNTPSKIIGLCKETTTSRTQTIFNTVEPTHLLQRAALLSELTRALEGGGGGFALPSCFSQISNKLIAQCLRAFQYLTKNERRIF